MKRQKIKFWQKYLLFGVMLLFSQQLFSQIKGKVTDSGGVPIPGATILEKGTSNGVISNSEGQYQIKVANQQTAILVFSFVGLEAQEVAVAGKTTVDVTLKESNTAIDEVVIVGYGEQKKATVTGAITTVTADELINGNILRMLSPQKGRKIRCLLMIRSCMPLILSIKTVHTTCIIASREVSKVWLQVPRLKDHLPMQRKFI